MTGELKPYPVYQDLGVLWLGPIPAGWEVRRLKTLFREVDVRTQTGAETLLSLRMHRGLVGHLASGGKPISADALVGFKLTRPGQIVMNRMRAAAGLFAVTKQDGLVSPDYAVLDAPQGLSLDYYVHLFKTPPMASEFRRESKGLGTGESGFLRLYTDRFGMIRAPFPSESEQVAIVRFLGHVDGRIGRYIRAKQKLIALLSEQKQAIIHRAVNRGLDPNVRMKPSGVEWLGEVPEHWSVRRLKWVAWLQRGYDLPADHRVPGEFPVVSSGGVIGTHSKALAIGPGVVIGRYGSTDAVHYVESSFWPHNTALFVADFQGNDPRWCYYLLKAVSKADHSAKSAVPGVDRKDLFEIPIAVPPRSEQRTIAEALDHELSRVDDAVRTAGMCVDSIREYRARLIADVVTGKLDVREAAARLPDEEPEATEPEASAMEQEDDPSDAADEEDRRCQSRDEP